MLLDIIIPHYNEPLEVVKPLIDILDDQKGVDFNDFRVWIVHNGDSTFHIQTNNLLINHIHLKENGVSRARNWGIEHSTADWICFCDCDDCYTSIFSLMMIFHVLKDKNSENFDLIWGSFYMQGAGPLIKSDKFNNVFIHNKYYRRSFLLDHNIRFCEYLHMSEDSAFNTIVKLEIAQNRIGQIDHSEPLYAWCRRLGSITMDKDKWAYNTEGHFERNLYVLNEYYKRELKDTNLMIARIITDAYAMINKIGYGGDTTAIKKRVADFYLENKEAYESVSEDILEKALATSNKDACITKEELESRPSLSDWLKEITSQSNQSLK